MFTTVDNIATITNAVFNSDGTIVYTYTSATSSFLINQIVSISGIVTKTDSNASYFNISDAYIIAVSTNTFTVNASYIPDVIPDSTTGYLSGGIVSHDPIRETMAKASSVSTNAAIMGEWNLNIAENINNVGNYKNRPNTSGFTLPTTFIQETSSTTNPTWYGYTDSTILIDGGVQSDPSDLTGTTSIPQSFQTIHQKMKNLYSLTDTVGKFRPRSGINKALYLGNGSNYFSYLDQNMALRPRYYAPDIADQFKYWTSYRQEVVSGNSIERGISKVLNNLAPNPSFENATNIITTRTNQITNPSFEVNTTGWAGANSATIATSTAQKYVGTQSLLVTYAAAPGTTTTGAGFAVSLSASTTYTFSAWVYTPTGSVLPQLSVQAGGGFTIVVSSNATTFNTWERISVTFTTTTAQTYTLYVLNGAAVTAGKTIYVDSVLLEIGSQLNTYFDGSTSASGDFTYFWGGTAHNSASGQQALIPTSWSTVYNPDGLYVSTYQSTDKALSGTHSYAVKVQNGTGVSQFNTGASLSGLYANQTYTASVYIWSNVSRSISIAFGVHATSGITYPSSSVTLTANAWTRVSVTTTLPNDFLDANIQIYNNPYAGDIYYFDQVLIENSASLSNFSSEYTIDDAAPFVTYTDSMPANRIIVKMQTGVGKVDLSSQFGFTDPFYGTSNKIAPVKWKVQYLDSSNNWIDAISFDNTSTRKDGTAIVKEDGYVELAYGLNIPTAYSSIFNYAGTYTTSSALPSQSITGYAYLITDGTNDGAGTFYIWTGNSYVNFPAVYGWFVNEETIDRNTPYVTQMVETASLPFPQYTKTSTGQTVYKQFQYINGMRIVVNTMSKQDATFDLIEMSPRLAINLSDKTSSLNVKKSASDLGQSGLPVGQLLVSTGNLVLFDYDKAFSDNNTSSLISKFSLNSRFKPIRKMRLKPPKKSKSSTSYIQIKIYDIVANVNNADYYVPIKTMYVDGFPEIGAPNREVVIQLRDLYFWLESSIAPQIFLPDTTVTFAISSLLDSIGFTNYSFKRVAGETDPIIPFFFVKPDTTVAQVLNEIATSFQMAMFFDEFNNLIIMSKNYLMPSYSQRPTSLTIYGSGDFATSGVVDNKTTRYPLTSIMDIKTEQDRVYNDGQIVYTSRYIQKSVQTIADVSLQDKDVVWKYKPVLLWEIAPPQNTKAANEQVATQKAYSLSAIPLNLDLSNSVPTVNDSHVIINNTIDFGEAVYWLGKYNGYFYANAEIIKFDAVQYFITGVGNVWLTSTLDYENYFSKLPFGGKIYPTGLVRIYAEPYYEAVTDSSGNPTYDSSGNQIFRLKSGEVAKHGRMQFGTGVKDNSGNIVPATHTAGIDSYWSDKANVFGCLMDSNYLLGNTTSFPTTNFNGNAKAGIDTNILNQANATTRNSIIKNILSSTYNTEKSINNLKTTKAGTVQSSALILNGATVPKTITKNPIDFISGVYKKLNGKYVHYGTRMRIIGEISNQQSKDHLYQNPSGGSPYYTNVGAASGGIAISINPATNFGYYFEIAALTEGNINNYSGSTTPISNVFFYKIAQDTTANATKAIPIPLWNGLTQIVVDDGSFTGQNRQTGEQYPSVYDLAIEYEIIKSKTIRFYLYINEKLIATVDDKNPWLDSKEKAQMYNSFALFVRGGAQIMFENVYALASNYSKNSSFELSAPVNSVFGDNDVNVNSSFKKYAMSGIIQKTYLNGIHHSDHPKHDMYFDEFGTIMREADYINARYDKAYPALIAKIAPTYNDVKGYVVSGFTANAYGAEFLIFNATDTTLVLDDTTGNYLRILGVTFTQGSNNQLTVDDYFNKKTNFADPQINNAGNLDSPYTENATYIDIKNSRNTYGKNAFTLDAQYIQDQDSANELMGWITSKLMQPRFAVGLQIFPNPTIQLGDIVEIRYDDSLGNPEIAVDGTRFVVYSIQYDRDNSGPNMILYLSEVA